MMALLKTAERINNTSFVNNYVFQRHVFAYKAIPMEYLLHKQVLELGCGEGYSLDLLARHTAHYRAVDKKKPQATLPANASFQTCHLPYLTGITDNSYDTVICFQVIEHIHDDHALLREIKRVLKPGGRLLLTTPNKYMSLSRNPFHVREYLPSAMKALMRVHFPEATVAGIYGNDTVMRYYGENKQHLDALARLDIFRLQYRLPAFLLKVPYTLLNNINRYFLLRKIEDVTVNINYSDFYFRDLDQYCLDYFVTAVKED
ncbi:class I SAM-dependent methyltransferase [Chitinophaga polysaccharea]|uniref:class I SAM-dependent methyltransferase n=1 Tax=Chitinophaga polysaccharea TaxID=1293035 RepID=UPI001454FAFF|nr:class I SAM-dependent methyltransferase [Chitinophaga polysaccharea]NLR60278.1 class I SAM-dependent methyltransferase [Chitinophaga polysaccharea]